jgi:uncharacterized protein YllA (UPF0747 family)
VTKTTSDTAKFVIIWLSEEDYDFDRVCLYKVVREFEDETQARKWAEAQIPGVRYVAEDGLGEGEIDIEIQTVDEWIAERERESRNLEELTAEAKDEEAVDEDDA